MTTLFDLIDPQYTRTATISERYQAFIDANPWLLPELARRAFKYRQAGLRCSAKALIEGMRSEWVLTRGEPFNFDNSLTSRLARDLVKGWPDLDGTFTFRALKEVA